VHRKFLLRYLQARLDARRKCSEIADALHFVVGQLDAEMMFQPREHFQRLQAINSEFLEEIIGRRKRFARYFEMFGGEVQDFVGGLVDGSHC
jgi:hypothetical protein